MSVRGPPDLRLTGEMGDRLRATEWRVTPLGDVAGWSDALKHSNSLILASAIPMAICWGPDLVTIYNDAYREILGDKHPAAFGRPLREIWPEIYDELGSLCEAILRGERPAFFAENHQWRGGGRGGRGGDGRFTISYSPIPDVTAPNGIGGLLLTELETTGQHRTRAALQESELHFRLLVDGVVDYAIYMLNPNGIVSSWNSGAQRIKGYRENEIVGQHFSRFYTPEDRAAGVPQQALARAAGGTPYEAEGWRVRKDGSLFWASVTLSAIRDNGKLVGFAKVTRDITERRQSQDRLRRAQEGLAQAEKLEMLGQLTGAIAHDFNNLLMVVGANTQLLKRRLVDPPSLRAVETIERAASRGEALTRRLLTFARRQDLNPIVIDLRERLAASRDVLASSAGENVELVFKLPDSVWPVIVDVPEFELALVNIVVNARDAMPNGGTIRISGGNVRLTPDDALDDLTGDFVELRISDTGSGIDPEALPRVFEPFFTTKGPDKGTGLGLSQVYGFARQSNGTVRVTSSAANGSTLAPRGTTVAIYLPRALGAVIAPDDAQREDEPEGGAERILLVEDNQEFQEVTATFLEELGYQVSRAANADAALERLASEKDIRLVFSDIVMPGAMNGVALARRVRRTYPHIAVLLTTGYAPQQVLLDDTLAVLRKPYRLTALSSALRDTLDRARTANRATRGPQISGR